MGKEVDHVFTSTGQKESTVDSETLQYPAKIAERIGLAKNEINAMKKKGCPFYGRKTSVRLVRAFMYRTMGAESLLGLGEHPQRSNGNISDAQGGLNG